MAVAFDATRENVGHNEGYLPDNHITGATIIGEFASGSVVNADCRTHDHPNLRIASSSTFPSVSSVNVTLSIAALAVEIGGAIADEATRCDTSRPPSPYPRPMPRGRMCRWIARRATKSGRRRGARRPQMQTTEVPKALHTGMHRPRDGEPERFEHAGALMFAALEDSVNAPGFRGGVPGSWANTPQAGS